MASRTNPVDEKTDIQEDLRVPASLWASLRTKYEGTNITRSIARLLHMYQPDEGIVAYERLLKTIIVLLEDFEAGALRLLVSMIPPPKDTSIETLKEVFLRATGFTRLESPIFHQREHLIPGVANPRDGDVKNSDGENVKTTALIKNCGEVGAAHEDKVGSTCYQTPQPNQEFSPFRGFTQANEYSMSQNYQKLNYYAAKNGQVLLDPGALSQGYKVNWIPPPYMLQNGTPSLPSSYVDFLVKTEDNKFMKVPMANMGLLMPCNSQNMQSYHPYQYLQNRLNYQSEKPATKKSPETVTRPQVPETILVKERKDVGKKSEVDNKCPLSKSDSSLLDSLKVSKSLESCIDRFLTRVKNNEDLQNKRINETSNRSEVSLQDRKELLHNTDSNYSQSEGNEWGKSCYFKHCDMSTYRRQYYDSVLNFQRPKDMANQMSAMASTSSYDSAYYEYMQQQWMYQHQRLVMGRQYPQRMMQSDLSSLRSPYSRPSDWVPHCLTSRPPQEGYSMNSAFYSPNVVPHYDSLPQNATNPSNPQMEPKSKEPRK